MSSAAPARMAEHGACPWRGARRCGRVLQPAIFAEEGRAWRGLLDPRVVATHRAALLGRLHDGKLLAAEDAREDHQRNGTATSRRPSVRLRLRMRGSTSVSRKCSAGGLGVARLARVDRRARSAWCARSRRYPPQSRLVSPHSPAVRIPRQWCGPWGNLRHAARHPRRNGYFAHPGSDCSQRSPPERCAAPSAAGARPRPRPEGSSAVFTPFDRRDHGRDVELAPSGSMNPAFPVD